MLYHIVNNIFHFDGASLQLLKTFYSFYKDATSSSLCDLSAVEAAACDGWKVIVA